MDFHSVSPRDACTTRNAGGMRIALARLRSRPLQRFSAAPIIVAGSLRFFLSSRSGSIGSPRCPPVATRNRAAASSRANHARGVSSGIHRVAGFPRFLRRAARMYLAGHSRHSRPGFCAVPISAREPRACVATFRQRLHQESIDARRMTVSACYSTPAEDNGSLSKRCDTFPTRTCLSVRV